MEVFEDCAWKPRTASSTNLYEKCKESSNLKRDKLLESAINKTANRSLAWPGRPNAPLSSFSERSWSWNNQRWPRGKLPQLLKKSTQRIEVIFCKISWISENSNQVHTKEKPVAREHLARDIIGELQACNSATNNERERRATLLGSELEPDDARPFVCLLDGRSWEVRGGNVPSGETKNAHERQ